MRPWSSGMRRIEKYSEPIKSIRISGEPRSARPRKLMRTSHPTRGGARVVGIFFGFSSGERSDAGVKLIEILGALLPSFARFIMKRDHDGETVLGIESEVEMKEPEKSLARGSGGSEQKNRQGDLRGDHCIVGPACAEIAKGASRTALQKLGEIRA